MEQVLFGMGCLPPHRPRETLEKWTYIADIRESVTSIEETLTGRFMPRALGAPRVAYRLMLIIKGENRRKHNRYVRPARPLEWALARNSPRATRNGSGDHGPLGSEF
jgi:hypothetical protein